MWERSILNIIISGSLHQPPKHSALGRTHSGRTADGRTGGPEKVLAQLGLRLNVIMFTNWTLECFKAMSQLRVQKLVKTARDANQCPPHLPRNTLPPVGVRLPNATLMRENPRDTTDYA